MEGDIYMFILGHPRAGTTFLARALNSSPEYCVIGETMYWGRGYTQPENGYSYTPNEQLCIINKIFDGRLNTLLRDGQVSCLYTSIIERLEECSRTPGDLFRYIAERAKGALGGKVFVEKTPHHIIFWPRIEEMMRKESICYIVCLRDFISFCRSYKTQGAQIDADVKRGFEFIYHPILPVMVWLQTMRYASDLEKSAAGRVYTIWLHEVESNPMKVLNNISDLSGVPRQSWNDISKVDRHSSTSMASEHNVKVEFIWFKMLGGANKIHLREDMRLSLGDWALFLISIIAFPVWIVRVGWGLRRNGTQNPIRYLIRRAIG